MTDPDRQDHRGPASAGPRPSAVETVRSEERVVVRSTTRVVGRVRLERTVVEEERTVVVRLRREQVRVVEVASDGAEVPDPDAARATPWVVLHEERPVVSVVAVPVERVRLVVDRVEGQEVRGVDVRREVVDVELTEGDLRS